MTSLTVAVVQAGSVLFDTPASLVKAEAFLRQAAAEGARLVVLPEAFLGGYPKGVDFGITVGSRTAEGRELFQRYAASAISLPGPEIEHLSSVVRELGVDVVAGVVERGGSTLYCSSVFITADGGHVATHRKLMPTAAERYLWGQGDGSTLATVRTVAGIVGSAICWENYMPLYRTAMYAKGVELWCAPTVDDRPAWAATMSHVALEGRCFVLSANQYLLRSDLPADVRPVQGDDPDTVLIGGGSMIVSPLGEVLAGPLRGSEGVLVADIDLGDITRARFDLDVVGHYSRPDVFRLEVDTSARPGVATAT